MTEPSLRHPLSTPPAMLVWGIGLGVYVLAMFHRNSLGVAGPLAAERLDLSAAALSSFVMLQLAVYALMQIPTGLLADRFGPRRVLLAATVIMGLGQIVFAVSTGYWTALLARGILGCGDAMTFVSVLRLVAAWFPAQKFAVMSMSTGSLGSIGTLVATLPLTGLLHGIGWTPTFLIAGGLSIAYGVLLVRPLSPPAQAPSVPATPAVLPSTEGTAPVHRDHLRMGSQMGQVWRTSADRLGLWVHFTAGAGAATFGTLWGFPYLTGALGMTPAAASSVLAVLVVGGLSGALVLGQLLGRRPALRMPLAVTVALLILLGWLLLIGWPGGRPPVAVVVAVVAVFSVGGPTSGIAFMLARDYNPAQRMSTASGFVNVGAWAGAVLCCLLVGVTLDLTDHLEPQTSFRWAFATIALVTATGLVLMVRWWRRSRTDVAQAIARGERVPVTIAARWWDLPRTKAALAGVDGSAS